MLVCIYCIKDANKLELLFIKGMGV